MHAAFCRPPATTRLGSSEPDRIKSATTRTYDRGTYASPRCSRKGPAPAALSIDQRFSARCHASGTTDALAPPPRGALHAAQKAKKPAVKAAPCSCCRLRVHSAGWGPSLVRIYRNNSARGRAPRHRSASVAPARMHALHSAAPLARLLSLLLL